MRRAIRALVAVAVLAAALPAAAQGLPVAYNAVSGREALDAAKVSGKPIVLYFTQRGCRYCDDLERLLAASKHRDEMVASYHFVDVNIHSRDKGSKALKEMLKVNGTPTLAFLTPRGAPLCLLRGSVADDTEIGRAHRTAMAAHRGQAVAAAPGEVPSCRGRATESDAPGVTREAP